jgi:hypothetical protein
MSAGVLFLSRAPTGRRGHAHRRTVEQGAKPALEPVLFASKSDDLFFCVGRAQVAEERRTSLCWPSAPAMPAQWRARMRAGRRQCAPFMSVQQELVDDPATSWTVAVTRTPVMACAPKRWCWCAPTAT